MDSSDNTENTRIILGDITNTNEFYFTEFFPSNSKIKTLDSFAENVEKNINELKISDKNELKEDHIFYVRVADKWTRAIIKHHGIVELTNGKYILLTHLIDEGKEARILDIFDNVANVPDEICKHLAHLSRRFQLYGKYMYHISQILQFIYIKSNFEATVD